MKISIDLERCAMAGECVYNHPTLFGFGDDDHPVVFVADPTSPAQQLGARQAAQVCPSGAIAVEE